ncbi:MAG: DUF58 domain-containing protein [Georgenia sp.]
MRLPPVPAGWGRRAERVRGGARVTVRALTPVGWAGLVGVVVAGTAGWLLGWAELVSAAGALLGLLLSAVLFLVGRQRFAVELRLAQARVVAGDRALGAVVVRNLRGTRAGAARIETPVGAGEVTFVSPALGAAGTEHASHEEVFAVPTDRRGVIAVGPVSSVRGDPLGLLRRTVAWTDVRKLFVHPRTVRLTSTAAGYLHDLEGRPSRALTSSDLSFHALREYQRGDDRRYVHWRSTAKAGTLMVRQFEETRRSHVVVALSRNGADYATSDELETAVSAAASLGLEALAEEKDLTVLTSHELLPTTSRRRLMDALTRLVPGSGPGGVVSMARTVARDVPHASVAVLVCGSPVTAHALRAAGAVLPLGVRALALRVDPAAEAGTSVVGAVRVVTVPSLEELPRTLRGALR